MAPAQGVHEAGDPLAPRPTRRAPRPRSRRGLTINCARPERAAWAPRRWSSLRALRSAADGERGSGTALALRAPRTAPEVGGCSRTARASSARSWEMGRLAAFPSTREGTGDGELANRSVTGPLSLPPMSQPPRSEWPIIIGGCHRSGTTLVRRILNSHSAIHCGPEVKFFLDFYGPPRGVKDDMNTARALASEDELLEFFGRGFVELHRRTAQRAGKPRWADKAPENVLYWSHWQRLLGDQWLFIHVVRNPLDTIASLREAGFGDDIPAHILGQAIHYLNHTRAGMRFGRSTAALSPGHVRAACDEPRRDPGEPDELPGGAVRAAAARVQQPAARVGAGGLQDQLNDGDPRRLVASLARAPLRKGRRLHLDAYQFAVDASRSEEEVRQAPGEPSSCATGSSWRRNGSGSAS